MKSVELSAWIMSLATWRPHRPDYLTTCLSDVRRSSPLAPKLERAALRSGMRARARFEHRRRLGTRVHASRMGCGRAGPPLGGLNATRRGVQGATAALLGTRVRALGMGCGGARQSHGGLDATQARLMARQASTERHPRRGVRGATAADTAVSLSKEKNRRPPKTPPIRNSILTMTLV